MILVAICSEYPHPTPNLEAVLDALRALGVEADFVPWKSTPISVFAEASAVLPLCCWDYYDDPAAFMDWIDALETRGARLLNEPSLLRWNFRKTYLLELAKAGLPVPKTFHLPYANHVVIVKIMEAQGWQTAVLKPVSSQSGHGVQKLVWAERDRWSIDDRTTDMLLQEFQADIASLGETTMTFIDGVFSHAVRRVLKHGEWRANPQFGITYEPVTATSDMIDAGTSYLAHLPQKPLYARVDGIARDSGFMLTELELIDPYLYCEFAPGSAERLARAILQRLG
ncbi:ATP-grasp domain-containing protein [Microvirga solisilvae]|uniref:ATP-grasp domain-containing protein n=1 Tax=Microvirga solisilvae TaxID=2919498 RepID=UPI001FAF3208|nr:hypothetical protein [Microvirga solisilvae]